MVSECEWTSVNLGWYCVNRYYCLASNGCAIVHKRMVGITHHGGRSLVSTIKYTRRIKKTRRKRRWTSSNKNLFHSLMVLGSYKLNWKFARRWKSVGFVLLLFLLFCFFFSRFSSLLQPSLTLLSLSSHFYPSHSMIFLLHWFGVSHRFFSLSLSILIRNFLYLQCCVCRFWFCVYGFWFRWESTKQMNSIRMWRNVSKYNILWLVAWFGKQTTAENTRKLVPRSSQSPQKSKRQTKRENEKEGDDAIRMNRVKCAF